MFRKISSEMEGTPITATEVPTKNKKNYNNDNDDDGVFSSGYCHRVPRRVTGRPVMNGCGRVAGAV